MEERYLIGYHTAMDNLPLTARTLRDARRRTGLSLRAAAKRAHTSHSSLSAYEHGRKVPSLDTFSRILKALGFAVRIELEPRIRERDGMDRGQELVEVLQLAEQFPARQQPPMQFLAILGRKG